MNLRHLTARTAIAGVATALAAGALVGVSATAANAVDNTSSYDCTAFGASQGTFTLKISTPVIPATATAGQSFPAGLLNLDALVTIPSSTATTLGGAGVNGGRIDDYAGSLGTTTLAAPLVFGAPTPQSDGSATMAGTGSVGAFTLPKAGTDKVQLPKSFTFTPTTASGDLTVGGTPVLVSCTSAAPGDLGTVKVTKGTGTITPKAKKVKKGYAVTVAVTRSDSKIKPTGKVTAKYGSKKVTKALKKGKAVLTLPKAAKGKKVTITYSGDGYVKAGKAVIKKLK
ncbi:hypothetical protein ASC77_12065 [Nocardioides sp. Root1257]|uniref:hypothetical protein n=1 Tax=unclassified Nocardioides TaxID=2615069 RepID=UPI0006F79850|nr:MULTISPECIES: hypothetical protein [unclassified Nocardioides]KQW49398.1 hypothetical protein ASC77_12065 [Nocardioides sp. Root1257]KRC48572.1 hypothetical protein ASE24_12070 [Nocardioides sp. Root224]